MISYFKYLLFILSAQALAMPASYRDLNSSSCQDFKQFSVGNIDKKDGFNTDGLVVYKNQKIRYEFYDGDSRFGGSDKGLFTQSSPHGLWSASKTISTTLVARAIQDKWKDPYGIAISTQTPLYHFFQPEKHRKNSLFYKINMGHLASMSAGFEWDESYESGVQTSTFLPMLYFPDVRKSMLTYALNAPLKTNGPGREWVYSGGNSVMLLASLGKIAKDRLVFPWELLFDPLKMDKVVFEVDGEGTFIGNSYVHMTPRDMAKVGVLYLQDGVYEGKKLLSSQWVKEASQVSRAQQSLDTPYEYIKQEGVYSERGFWLNKTAQGYGPEFPNSPRDMYFAAGHYGQLIIVIPSEAMVIARTGHDSYYWDKIDDFVSKTVKCFGEKR